MKISLIKQNKTSAQREERELKKEISEKRRKETRNQTRKEVRKKEERKERERRAFRSQQFLSIGLLNSSYFWLLFSGLL